MKTFTLLGAMGCLTFITLSPLALTAGAQTVSADRLLSVPAAPRLRCRMVSPSVEDAARGVRAYLQIEEVRRPGTGTREDDVWYDSTGKALWMTETVTTVNGDGGANLDAITAVRAPDGRFVGSHVRYDGAAVGANDPVRSRQTAPLSEEDGRAARVLTEWFWSHRCRPLTSPRGERN